MVEVIFEYKTNKIKIECNENDKIKDIINKFIIKTQLNVEKCYIYNGGLINEELTFKEQANTLDRERKKMNVIVYDSYQNYNEQTIIKSKDIICPKCKEIALINIKDYRINFCQCKNNHIEKNISFEEYENTQKIDLSTIKCDNCKEKNIRSTNNNEFYICNVCNKKLCPLCSGSHDNNHIIISYNNKNNICIYHNNIYKKYCKNCKNNICELCEDEHKNHNLINIETNINKNNLKKENEKLKNCIGGLKNIKEEINNKLNKVVKNMEIYYNITKDIITNYDSKNKNYYSLKNIYEIKESNNNIIKDINNIINERDINKKFNRIMKIYDNINYIYKSQIYENGDEYIGEFKNNKRNGYGVLYYNKNNINMRDRYEGDWKDDKIEGKGKIYWNNGDKYEGDFINGIINGNGIILYNKNDECKRKEYDGEWKDGKKEGKGIMYWNNGERYEGDWKNDKIEGKGIYYYVEYNEYDIDRYEGEWKDGKKEGKGKLYWNNGDRYEGDFKNDMASGKGIYYYSKNDEFDRNRYDGEWKNGKKEGKGIMYLNNGERYEGDFKSGKIEGKGIYYFQNGNREMGDYLDDKKIGIHIYLYSNGEVIENIYLIN